MNINSISSAVSSSSLTSTQAVQNRRSGAGDDDHTPIAVAAKALGLSTDDVQSRLDSGASLGDIADAQGVSRDDLATALKNGAPSELQGSSDLDAMVSSMIDQVGGPQGPQGAQGPPPQRASSGLNVSTSSSGVLSGSLTDDQQSTLDSLASLLGTDSTSLMGALQSGTSLSDLLSSSGASTSDLAGILQDGLMVDATA